MPTILLAVATCLIAYVIAARRFGLTPFGGYVDRASRWPSDPAAIGRLDPLTRDAI